MQSKGIMLCNGPLSGRQEIVRGNMTVYEYFEYPGNIINDEVGVIAKRRSYLKTEYKFGDLEIFIWEEGIK